MPRRRAPLRAKTDRRWAKLRLSILERDGGRCQYPGCGDPATDVHHIAPRSTNPELKYEPDNLLSLCRPCHTTVGDSPTLAHALGLHAFSWEGRGAVDRTAQGQADRKEAARNTPPESVYDTGQRLPADEGGDAA